MVIPLILGGIARGAAMAGRGIATGARAAGRGVSSVKNDFQNMHEDMRDRARDAYYHPLSQKLLHPITEMKNPVGNLSRNALKYGGYGLMGGMAVGAAVARGGHRAAQNLGENEIGQKPALILIFPVILTVIDYFYGTNGISLDSIFTGRLEIIELLGRIGTSVPYWAAVIIYWIIKKPQSKEEWMFPLALFMLGFFTLTFGVGSRWVFLHSVFAVITFAYLLDGFNADIKGIHWAFLIMVFMDIFGLATINNLFPETVLNFDTKNQFLSGNISTDIFFNRLLVPYWFFFYLFQIRPGRIKTTIAIGLTLFYTGYGLSSIVTPGVLLDTADLDVQKKAAQNAVVKVIATWRDTISSWLTEQIGYAVTGKVEKNQYEPLGVSLENVQSADPRYYEDEKVIIWGAVKARTLDDPIHLKVGCFAQKDINKRHADKVDPDKKFTVFTLEEQDFACTFNETAVKRGILKTGSNTIKTFAEFNFETLAFLKVYFINRERQRAMVREDLDPFEEFAITDRNPIAVYTNGPAKIEMGTNNPLISVSEDYIVEPSLDIKIDNREGWQGEIKMLKELVLFLPEGVEMDPWLSCNRKFLDYDVGMCKTKSCVKFVKNECLEVCDGFIKDLSSCSEAEACKEDKFSENCINCKRALEINSYNSCAGTCNENFDTCQTACDSFFLEGGQEYKGYSLDTKDVKYRDEEKDFEKGKLFRCRFRPDPDAVLGASPFTIKSFRVKARYNYSLEKSVSVEIVGIPKEEKMHVGPPRDLRGHVENVKEEDGKIVGDIVTEWERSVNDGSGANDVIGYRVYRKEKLEDDWGRIADFNVGTNTFEEEGKTWYRYIDHVEFPADFKYYYHAEAIDDEGNWEKSSQMLEIMPGLRPEEPKASLLERPKEEGELA